MAKRVMKCRKSCWHCRTRAVWGQCTAECARYWTQKDFVDNTGGEGFNFCKHFLLLCQECGHLNDGLGESF